MNPECAKGGFPFDHCCLQRSEGCFDDHFTFEFCCPGISKVSKQFGDPTCFADITGYYNYERCCFGVGDDDCFREAFTRERCCGVPSHTDFSACRGGLGEPWLAHWDQDASGSASSWTFTYLTRVTAVILFTLPGAEVGFFNASFRVWADAGLGARELGQVTLAGRGEYLHQQTEVEDWDVYSLTLNLQSWQGHPALLYMMLNGCRAPKAKNVALVHCRTPGPHLPLGMLEDMYGWLVVRRQASDAKACFRALDGVLRELKFQDRLGNSTVILSPYLHTWHPQLHSTAVWRLSELLAPPATVLGLPISGGSGNGFVWPLRKVRRQYWKLQYSEYPTGSARFMGRSDSDAASICHGGDAISGSRIYRSDILAKLLERLPSASASGAEWLVALDLEAIQLGESQHTFLCAVGVFDEEDHLRHAKLTIFLSERYDVEVAKFHDSPLSVNCAALRKFAKPSTGEFDGGEAAVVMTDNGLVSSWCFRSALREALRRLSAWWQDLSKKGHYLVPTDGTGLSLLRNPSEPMPWDHDVDVWLVAEGGIDLEVGDLLSENSETLALQKLSALGFRWSSVLDYSAKGGGWHIAMQFMDESLSPAFVLDLDAVIKGYVPRRVFPSTTAFFGAFAATGQNHILGLARKYSSARKTSRNWTQLHCKLPGHTSCIPSWEAGRPAPVASCEFEDRFVLLDWFE
ncbi:unnamed protein product [Effrenium voratum]|uniref:Uncharacterized protein n=1 Tax=Effrenium voratum TaxID=2562239 RepID=A0AA36NDU9_9DINO|nr:unnamed protein product [Effrenium voratum]